MPPTTIAVFGSSLVTPNDPEYAASLAVGAALARQGWAVMTGGYGGVMEGASRGAHEAGGHVIGVTSAQIEALRGHGANPWVREEVSHPLLKDRMNHLIVHSHGYVVMPGGIGTLAELAMTWEAMRIRELPARPVVAFGAMWRSMLTEFAASRYVPDAYKAVVAFADDAEGVVAALHHGFAHTAAMNGALNSTPPQG